MTHGLILVGWVFGTGVAMPPPSDKPAAEEPFIFQSRKPGMAVAVRMDKDRAIFDFTAPIAINTVTVERRRARWPEAVTLRLHLRGLEFFTVRTDTELLKISVSSTGAIPGILVSRGKEEKRVAADDPWHPGVRLCQPNDARPASIPLKAGYFEIDLPRKLLEGPAARWTLDWIDFYR